MLWNKKKFILVLKGYEFGGAQIQKYCKNIDFMRNGDFMRMDNNLDIEVISNQLYGNCHHQLMVCLLIRIE